MKVTFAHTRSIRALCASIVCVHEVVSCADKKQRGSKETLLMPWVNVRRHIDDKTCPQDTAKLPISFQYLLGTLCSTIVYVEYRIRMLCHGEALQKQSGFRCPLCSYHMHPRPKAHALALRSNGEATRLSISSTSVRYTSNTKIPCRLSVK